MWGRATPVTGRTIKNTGRDIDGPRASQLITNMTSSIKPEILNISLRSHCMTESRPYLTCTKIGEDRTCSSEDMIADRQTHTQTHTDRQTDRQTRSSQYSASPSGAE